jgi:hypothetical protein
MNILTVKYFRQKLKTFFNGVNSHTSRDVNDMDTTSYLLKSPANAIRLSKSIDDYKSGLGTERSLIE